jgi:hypothetical protein
MCHGRIRPIREVTGRWSAVRGQVRADSAGLPRAGMVGVEDGQYQHQLQPSRGDSGGGGSSSSSAGGGITSPAVSGSDGSSSSTATTTRAPLSFLDQLQASTSEYSMHPAAVPAAVPAAAGGGSDDGSSGSSSGNVGSAGMLGAAAGPAETKTSRTDTKTSRTARRLGVKLKKEQGGSTSPGSSNGSGSGSGGNSAVAVSGTPKKLPPLGAGAGSGFSPSRLALQSLPPLAGSSAAKAMGRGRGGEEPATVASFSPLGDFDRHLGL